MIELFSGDGNFTEIFKTYTLKIYCYENGEDAVSRLQKRKLDGVTAKNIDLYSKESIHKILRDCDNADTLALDPPRSGFKELGILADELKNLKRIIYISCDLMTFCRDVASLSKKWTRKKLATFDMFPQTPHVELIALIERD